MAGERAGGDGNVEFGLPKCGSDCSAESGISATEPNSVGSAVVSSAVDRDCSLGALNQFHSDRLIK
jgi:hypothetical protein